ncbi:MAG: hypothetical protein IJT49_09525 [Clostridia bacterium]|nr:hypothetical protein [Clostridia bacterium]
MSAQKSTQKRMYGSIAAIIALAICLVLTTFALVYATVSVEENLFRTGRVKINLNDGEPIIREDEFLFEPGMTVKKNIFIENESTWDVYYKLYFSNVEGGLADVLQITVEDGDKVLYSGTMNELSKDKALPVNDPLTVMERKTLTVVFHFPEEKGNATQALYLKFDMHADAVQTKNNPDRLFR